MPFAALPHAIAGDPGVPPTAKAVLLALLYWARGSSSCWPSDGSIGKRIGRHPGTVSRWLAWLEARDLIRRERADNRTGRLIILRWRETPQAPALEPPPAPALDEGDRARRENQSGEPEREPRQRSRPDDPPSEAPGQLEGRLQVLDQVLTEGPEDRPRTGPGPAPKQARILTPAPETPHHVASSHVDLTPAEVERLGQLTEATRERVLAWIASGDQVLQGEARKLLAPPKAPPAPPETVAELLERVLEDPANVAAGAALLCREFDDERSFAGYHAKLAAVWRGEVPTKRLVDAWHQATSGRAKSPPKLFMHLMGR